MSKYLFGLTEMKSNIDLSLQTEHVSIHTYTVVKMTPVIYVSQCI